MATAVPTPPGVTGQAQVGLMDQGSGAQRLPRLLLLELPRGQPAQLLVNQRQKLARGLRIALIDGG